MPISWIIVAGVCCSANGDPQIVRADPTLKDLPPLTQQACMETAVDLNKMFIKMNAGTMVHCEPKQQEEDNN